MASKVATQEYSFSIYRHFLENQYIKCQWEVVCGKENHNFFLP